METVKIEMEIPKDFLYAFDISEKRISNELKLLSAIELYREHKISMGKAAEFAQLDKFIFQQELSSREIPVIDYNIDEIKAESETLSNIRKLKK